MTKTYVDPWASEYNCIAADPPWPERGGGKIKRGCDRHYPVIKTKEEILQVMLQAPCWRPAESCHLWLWCTNSYLEWALWLVGALGFKYKTNRAWAKMKSLEYYNEVLWAVERIGLGQYLRGAHELLLFGARGPTIKGPTETRPPTLLLAPRTSTHSEKPEQAYLDMEAVTPSVGPRLEMFAAGDPRPGWDKWMPMVHR